LYHASKNERLCGSVVLFVSSLGRFWNGNQSASKVVMNLNAITNNSLEAILDGVLQNYSLFANNNTNGVNSGGNSSANSSDNSNLSPLAQLISFLQQLQQSNPVEYRLITHQISANLQAAAQTDQADGNAAGASQLNQLSADFTSASTSGQLPNLQDLAQALSSAPASSDTAISLSQLDQLLASLQANTSNDQSQNSSQYQNPLSVIFSTLSNAGFSVGTTYTATN